MYYIVTLLRFQSLSSVVISETDIVSATDKLKCKLSCEPDDLSPVLFKQFKLSLSGFSSGI